MAWAIMIWSKGSLWSCSSLTCNAARVLMTLMSVLSISTEGSFRTNEIISASVFHTFDSNFFVRNAMMSSWRLTILRYFKFSGSSRYAHTSFVNDFDHWPCKHRCLCREVNALIQHNRIRYSYCTLSGLIVLPKLFGLFFFLLLAHRWIHLYFTAAKLGFCFQFSK